MSQLKNDSEWGNPTFTQTKLKTYWVNFIRNFRHLNNQLKVKTCSMPKTNEVLLELEGFKYDKSLNLNMRYFHIQLSEE